MHFCSDTGRSWLVLLQDFFSCFGSFFLGAFFKIFSSLSVSDVEDRQLCFVQSLVFIFCISSFFKTFLNHLPMFTPLQWLNAGCYSVGAVGYSARNATWKSISNPWERLSNFPVPLRCRRCVSVRAAQMALESVLSVGVSPQDSGWQRHLSQKGKGVFCARLIQTRARVCGDRTKVTRQMRLTQAAVGAISWLY